MRGGASDIHLKAGLPPMFRVNGSLVPLRDADRLSPENTAEVAGTLMTPAQRSKFKEELDMDLAYGVPGLGRFRVNAFVQRGSVGLVFRVIPTKIQTIQDLYLPKVIETIANNRRGLILVTGATGSGKSTTLAGMIEHINRTRTEHIITVEDPIEFMIRDRRCIINQREIGNDTKSFHRALKAALRQDPDVILVGEMRDIETMEIALTAAETGHLVMSTLHTIDAPESIARIVSSFPAHQHKSLTMQLATILKAVVSQRLVPRSDGKGRVPAIEVMINTQQVKELIMNNASARVITDAIAKGHMTYGSQTFDQSLMGLVRQNLITYEEALRQSTSPDDFALRFSGIESSENAADWDNFEAQEEEEDILDDDEIDFKIDRF